MALIRQNKCYPCEGTVAKCTPTGPKESSSDFACIGHMCPMVTREADRDIIVFGFHSNVRYVSHPNASCASLESPAGKLHPFYPNNFRNVHIPIPLSTGIVKLSSHPKTSTTSLADATNPVQRLMTARAKPPEIDP